MSERKKVLVIDDEPLVCRSVKKILDLESVDTETATSGREGLVMARNTSYDLLLVDVKMPEMNGYAVVRMVRELQPKLPIVVISGYNTPHTREQAFTSGANGFVPKPFLPEEIRDVVLKFLRGVAGDESAGAATDESGREAPPEPAARDPKSAVGYVCAVPDPDAGTPGIEDQKTRICRFADSAGLVISSVYEDQDTDDSALKRPAILRILDVESKPGALIVDNVGCLARNRRDLCRLLEVLDEKGIRLKEASGKMDFVSQFARMWYQDREAARCAPMEEAAGETEKDKKSN